jgi:hypothetical protein
MVSVRSESKYPREGTKYKMQNAEEGGAPLYFLSLLRSPVLLLRDFILGIRIDNHLRHRGKRSAGRKANPHRFF